MRVSLVQFDGADRPCGDRITAMAERVGACGESDLIVLPELWATGYFHFDDYAATAEVPGDGPISSMLAEASRSTGSWVHGGSLLARRAGGGGELQNTSVVFAPTGELRATYAKAHLFGAGSREPDLVRAGTGPVAVSTPWGQIGLSVCYDLRFPELYRHPSVRAAILQVIVAAWPAARREHWEALARARAIENQAFVLACNGAGADNGTDLAGNSLVVDPLGKVLARGSAAQETLSIDIDLGEVERARHVLPVLDDVRFAAHG